MTLDGDALFEPASPRIPADDPERRRNRAAEDRREWRRWGPYLAERQWGTVREDYSPDGKPWTYFTHEQARSRAYRWGEDGLLGISDIDGGLCFALSLWNGRDPFLKERLYGLTGDEGNHGEDVKECYYYLDALPSHAYLKALYKYPQCAFPYDELRRVNQQRSRDEPEFEITDTTAFADSRYFDVVVEYAKAAPNDILIRITAHNRGAGPAPLYLIPTLWFRNTWSWGRDQRRPLITDEGAGRHDEEEGEQRVLRAGHHALGEYWLACAGSPQVLFTENDSNLALLFDAPNPTPFVKDAFHRRIVTGDVSATNPGGRGTKAAAVYVADVPGGGDVTVRLRLSQPRHAVPFSGFDAIITQCRQEADAFYAPLGPADMPADARRVQRQAFAGLIWSKQFYYWDVDQWLEGDPGQPPPPPGRERVRNLDWRHLNNADIISMPDTWEYPWYASWDLAFHCIPLALIDPHFAKRQITLLLREWYMHPNGQLPAYEWALSDVNPPVHAWAALRVFLIERRVTGEADTAFLERAFHKLLLNFTWWVNRKDPEGNNVFQGGFLGLDNIGAFDRSSELPGGGHLEQSDGTAWMGMYCLTMMRIALELAAFNPVYEDVASKFFEHFMYIAGALNNIAGAGIALWDSEDEFCYDILHLPGGRAQRVKLRSMVGLIPLLAVETIEPALLDRLPGFRARMDWFLENRPQLAALVSRWQEPGLGERRLLALLRGHRMKRLLARMLDPEEFLSPHGVRSLSKAHAHQPYQLHLNGVSFTVAYEPAESRSGLFGGNSNWRGPVWLPLNFLLIEALQKYHHYYGDDFVVEHPAGSGHLLDLWSIASDLSRRLTHLFMPDREGRRPAHGANHRYQHDPHWRDLVLFYEYFHGDTGAGLGASHQTGWTALVAKLLEQTGGR